VPNNNKNKTTIFRPVELKAPGIIERASVKEAIVGCLVVLFGIWLLYDYNITDWANAMLNWGANFPCYAVSGEDVATIIEKVDTKAVDLQNQQQVSVEGDGRTYSRAFEWTVAIIYFAWALYCMSRK
jgi:hypothetical protein